MPTRLPSALVHSGRFDSPFFRSEFRVPAAPEHVIHRVRLTELLDGLAEYPMTAVVAPPGRRMLHTVASDGAAVLDLMELAAWRAPSAWMDRLRRVLVPRQAGPPAVPGLVEELTSRERDVRRLLPTRVTPREIASERSVSQNTLKFHLRVIYRKLGVNSRADAVATAHRLGLQGRDQS